MAATKTRLRPRKLPTLPKHLHARDAIWNGHDDYFSGPIPPVDHAKSVEETAWLTRTQLAMWKEDFVDVNPQELFRVLNRAGVKFVLMGAHVTNSWSRVERATHDVDVLVQRSHHRKAVQAIQKAFPMLHVEDNPVVTRFRDPSDDRVAIDVMKPAHEIHKAALKHTVRVRGTYEVPILEMALACKFAAFSSPNRARDRKLQDVVDFSRVVLHNKDAINRTRLRAFGDLVYSGGGAHVIRMVDDVIANRPMLI